MAATANKKRQRFYTPALVALWPWLTTPDKKFDADGAYKVTLQATQAEADAIQAAVKADVDEQERELRQQDPKQYSKWKVVWPIKDETDEQGNDTGNKLIAFSQKAVVKRVGKEDMVFDVKLFDAKKTPVAPSVKLGSGSVLKLCYNVRVVPDKLSKCIRVKLQPLAAQIITLVEFGGGDFGFGEEAGYEASEATPATAPTEAGAAAHGDNPDF